MMKFLTKISDYYHLFEKFFLITAITLMVLIIFFDFLIRELFGTGFVWGKELSSFLMIWVGFIGASYATKENKHLVVGVPEKLFPKRILPYISLFVNLIVFLVTIFLAYLGFVYVQETKEIGETSLLLNIPLWIVQIIIPVSLVFIALRFVSLAILILQGKVTSIGEGSKKV
jgi:C4-dicarboxylate transporter DctQ subunit